MEYLRENLPKDDNLLIELLRYISGECSAKILYSATEFIVNYINKHYSKEELKTFLENNFEFVLDACFYMNYPLIELFVESGVDLNIDLDNRAGVILSTYGKDILDHKLIQYLIDHGAEVNIEELLYADIRVDVAKILLENKTSGDIDPDVLQQTDDYELMELLLEHGVDPNIPYKSGDTVLGEWVAVGDYDYVKLLLEYGADPNVKYDDLSILAYSIIFINWEITELLIKYKADINDMDFLTYLINEYPDKIYQVIEAGADITNIDLDNVGDHDLFLDIVKNTSPVFSVDYIVSEFFNHFYTHDHLEYLRYVFINKDDWGEIFRNSIGIFPNYYKNMHIDLRCQDFAHEMVVMYTKLDVRMEMVHQELLDNYAHFMYRPGGLGYKRARDHFDELAVSNNNN